MNNIDNQKRFYINKLYEIYGLLLTEKQQQMFEDYYQKCCVHSIFDEKRLNV